MDQLTVKAILNSRVQVSQGGKYQVRVTSTPNYYQDPEGSRPNQFLVSTNGIAPDQAAKARFCFKEGDYDEALVNTNLSFGILEPRDGGQPDWLPSKGEVVNIVVDYVPNRDGKEVLRIVSMTPLPTNKSSKFSVEAEEELIVEEAKQEELVA